MHGRDKSTALTLIGQNHFNQHCLSVTAILCSSISKAFANGAGEGEREESKERWKGVYSIPWTLDDAD